MKQANNNQLDVLLRSFARRAGKPSAQSASGNGQSSDHLDADELNSYAEGVVPAAARSRYTEHLADCDMCRGMVVSLSQSSGAASAFNVSDVQESTFWQKVSAFFSPAVLRFAVPALMLTVVIGVGLFALRQQGGNRQSDYIAQNTESAAADPRVGLTKAGEASAPNATPPPLRDAASNPVNAGSSPAVGTDQKKLDTAKPVAAEPPATTSESTIAKAPLAKDGAAAGAVSNVAELRPYSPEPKAAPPAPASAPGTLMSDAAKSGDDDKAPAKREAQQRSRDEFRMQREEEHGPNRSRSQSQASPGRTSGLMANRGPSNTTQNKGYDNNYVSHTASGRRFVRSNNIWVDTEYDSSRATISVKRNSDQFRALVADEPGIRTIAEQLSGVVIVVWKNRAYRIQ